MQPLFTVLLGTSEQLLEPAHAAVKLARPGELVADVGGAKDDAELVI